MIIPVIGKLSGSPPDRMLEDVSEVLRVLREASDLMCNLDIHYSRNYNNDEDVQQARKEHGDRQLNVDAVISEYVKIQEAIALGIDNLKRNK